LVSEQYVLDLEREAFVSLCGEKKTQERIAHTLKTGKRCGISCGISAPNTQDQLISILPFI